MRSASGSRSEKKAGEEASAGGAVTKQVRKVSEQEESNCEIPAGETNDTDEDDAYDYAGIDGSCSEESGSATEKDTPTRIALE